MSPENDYTGAIFMFGGNFSPPDYKMCVGSLLAIGDFTLLYAVIGSTYGGDGRRTVGLPDLRGRALIGTGTAPNLTPLPLGYPAGKESTSIQIPENALPAHTHSGSFNSADLNNNATATVDLNNSYVMGTVNCNFLAGGSTNPAGQYPGYDGSVGAWSNVTNNSLMASDVVTDGSISNIDITNNFNSNDIPVIVVPAGDDQAIEHSSIPPFLTVNYLIMVNGLFPPHPSPPPSQIHAESGADV